MTSVLRIISLINALLLIPIAAQAMPPARDKTTWSLIDVSGKVVRSGVGEYYAPDNGPGLNAASGVLVRNAIVDGHSVFQTKDAKDKHVMATFPPDILLGYAIDPSGLVLILRLEKGKYGNDHFVYGFAKATGEIVVAPEYDSAGPFGPNGLAPVHKDQRVGFIDTDGKLQIPLQFLDGKTFGDNGLAPVRTETGWGYIDASGAFTIPPQYTDAKPFNGKDLAPAAKGRWGYIDHPGAFVISPQFDDAWTFWPDGTALIKFAGMDKTFIDRQFGPWRLTGKITPQPEHPVMGPDPWAYVQVTGRSADQSLIWTFSTHGEGLNVETEILSPTSRFSLTTIPDFPSTDAEFADVLNANVQFLFTGNSKAGQKYNDEIANNRTNLLSALSAMRENELGTLGQAIKALSPSLRILTTSRPRRK